MIGTKQSLLTYPTAPADAPWAVVAPMGPRQFLGGDIAKPPRVAAGPRTTSKTS